MQTGVLFVQHRRPIIPNRRRFGSVFSGKSNLFKYLPDEFRRQRGDERDALSEIVRHLVDGAQNEKTQKILK